MRETDQAWTLVLTIYGEGEYHSLSRDDLLDLLEQEWAKDFNSFVIGRDYARAGQLSVFFWHSNAFVGYDDFVSGDFWSSFDEVARNEANWEEMVRLSPDDTHDWSFARYSIIPKEQAWTIVEEYVKSMTLTNLRKEDGSAV